MQGVVELHSGKMKAVPLFLVTVKQQKTGLCGNRFWSLIRCDQNVQPEPTQKLRQTFGTSALHKLSRLLFGRSWSFNLTKILAINVLQKNVPRETKSALSWSMRPTKIPKHRPIAVRLPTVRFGTTCSDLSSIKKMTKNSIRIMRNLCYFIHKIIWILVYNSNLESLINSNMDSKSH